MSRNIQLLVNILMVIIPWLSVPFMGIRNLKKFLPASLLVFLMGIIDVQIGKKRRWWTFYNKPSSYFLNEFPFHIGPFLVGSMWVLKWGYGSIPRFILLNVITNAIFAGPLTSLTKNVKLFRTVWLSRIQFFFYFFYKSFFLYLFQRLFNAKKDTVSENNE
ncbi:hypothetical protein [Aquisalibacillus elongatus]|uniref:Uncharacterized protein n=1 Tax=Aquisalibacillus elongatus TaxID=485577 RepID=A0A3N5AZH8_9BACI|nr:hypothetical protein [Aquisalibacillus elongatus]RPF50407.1 hypothetical protein EDC24_2846 [Aquisalibacillus elongatus]